MVWVLDWLVCIYERHVSGEQQLLPGTPGRPIPARGGVGGLQGPKCQSIRISES